jgi:VWFA-related protein
MLCVASSVPAAAQFVSDVPLVSVKVSALDALGRPVSNLPSSSVSLYEDGELQHSIMVNNDDTPISLGILLERGTACPLSWEQTKSAVLTLLEALPSRDEVYIAGVGQAEMHRISLDGPSLTAKMDGLHVHPDLGASQSVRLALKWLSRNARTNRLALILITDATGPKRSVSQDVMRDVVATGATIYTIRLGEQPRKSSGRNREGEIAQLVDATGGALYIADFTYGSSDDDARKLAKDLHSGYNVLYSPPNGLDGRYHQLRVQIASETVFTVRARQGYYSYDPKTLGFGQQSSLVDDQRASTN